MTVEKHLPAGRGRPSGYSEAVSGGTVVAVAGQLPAEARYGRRLVAGAKVLEIFGDLETEIAIRTGGDEGLCVGYDSVEFLAPLSSGDFIEARARVVGVGRTSRRIEAELYKVLSADGEGSGEVHDPPILAARATATIVPARKRS